MISMRNEKIMHINNMPYVAKYTSINAIKHTWTLCPIRTETCKQSFEFSEFENKNAIRAVF